MDLFDTHFHYNGENGPLEYVRKMRTVMNVPPQSSIAVPEKLFLMAVGCDYIESRRAMEFAGAVENSFFAVGVQPSSAAEYRKNREDFSAFRNAPKLRAIGEIGLDYYYDGEEKEVQKSVFSEFLDLALAWDLPAIIHCRDKNGCFDAYADMLSMLTPFAANGGRFVLHCYAGDWAYAEKFLALGAFLGVTGMVTFSRAENIRENVRRMPPDRLLIETDSPYLAPVPVRGQENHPGFLIHAAKFTAGLRGMDLEEFAALTVGNAKRFFRISE